MATQIANQTTRKVLDLVVEAENTLFEAMYEGSSDSQEEVHAQPEVLQALREARDAVHRIRVLAHRLNRAP